MSGVGSNDPGLRRVGLHVGVSENSGYLILGFL